MCIQVQFNSQNSNKHFSFSAVKARRIDINGFYYFTPFPIACSRDIYEFSCIYKYAVYSSAKMYIMKQRKADTAESITQICYIIVCINTKYTRETCAAFCL